MVKDMTPQARYDAAHTVMVPLKLNRKTDADILEVLGKQPNRQGYIKQALREYIKEDQNDHEIL